MNRGVILRSARTPVIVTEVPVCQPSPGEVLVKMEACGICHSDLFIAGLEKPPLLPLLLGHEGIGRIVTVGPGVQSFALGDRVGITFLASTCGTCEWCRTGRERYCPQQVNSGYTAPGALAGCACISTQYLVRVPDGLDAAEAAPLCCAGWTAYRAVQEAGLSSGKTIAIFGMGGLGHLALQYARLAHLRVAVVDVSDRKLERARDAGAEITVQAENAGRTLQKDYGGMDAAVVLTASAAAIVQAFRSLKRCGTLIQVGLAPGTVELPVIDSVLKGITIRGSFLGTRQDLEEVLALAATGAVRPHVERHSIDEAPELFGRMQRGDLAGRAVIEF